MRFLKLGLISFVFLFLLITAISLLLPSTINISRAIDITAPFDSVYSNINNVTKWKNWYANFDSAAVSFSNKTSGEGSSITMNKTTVAILNSNADKIKTVWHSGTRTLEGEFNFIKQNNASQVSVQWLFVQHVKWYPWEKLALIVTDKTIGPVMEKSLDNLKMLVEKQGVDPRE
ncbi:MAG TPA: hypothetical protein VF540_03595 [Segetibacter sp.]|jgi:hypothetical protein